MGRKEGRAKRGLTGGTSMRAVARPYFPERCPRAFFSSRRMHEDTLLTMVKARGSRRLAACLSTVRTSEILPEQFGQIVAVEVHLNIDAGAFAFCLEPH